MYEQLNILNLKALIILSLYKKLILLHAKFQIFTMPRNGVKNKSKYFCSKFSLFTDQ